MTRNKLYRSNDGVLLGVCQGIADWKNIPVFVVRLIFVVIALCTAIAPCLVIYLIVGLMMPARPVCEYSRCEDAFAEWKKRAETDEEYYRRKKESDWDNRFCNS